MQFEPVASLWGLDANAARLALTAFVTLMAVTHICSLRPMCQVSRGNESVGGMVCISTGRPSLSQAFAAPALTGVVIQAEGTRNTNVHQ